MTTVREFHNRAMELAQLAQIARVQDDQSRALTLAREAFELESQAALLVPDTREAEPTRGILYRSAASLAYQAGDYESAQRFVMRGLSGFPRPRERTELEQLYERIRFASYLAENRLTIGASFQIVLRGRGVDYGRVPYYEFERRANTTIDLLNRSVERRSGREYRKAGSVSPQLRSFVPLITPQAPGSFVVAVELAQPEAYQTTFMFSLDEVVDDVLSGVDLVMQGKREQLRERIPNETYYRNFIAATKVLAPDGQIITHVGLADSKQQVSFSTRKRDIPLVTSTEDLKRLDGPTSPIRVQGILDLANAREGGGLGLTSTQGVEYDVEVADGLEDYVRAYFKQIVVVTGRLSGKRIVADDITGSETISETRDLFDG